MTAYEGVPSAIIARAIKTYAVDLPMLYSHLYNLDSLNR